MKTTTPVRFDPRRARRKQKRGDVLWTIVFFFLLQIGFGAAINTGTVKLDNGTTFAVKTKQFQKQLDDFQAQPFIALAFGSSRIMNGFDSGSLIEPLSRASGREAVVYNFGLSGGGTIYSYLALEKLFASGIRPNLVLVEVYPMLLVGDGERHWFAANEMRSKSFENTARYGIKAEARSWHERWLVPWHTHRFFVLNGIAPELLPMNLRDNWAQNADDYGWVAVDKPLQQTQLEKQVKQFAHKIAKARLNDDPCRALKDTLTLCRQNNIECALIWMPECSELRDGYPADVEPVVTRFLDTLQREFDVALINARDWVDNQGFYDSRHLNRQGAVRFTRQLGQQSLPQLQLRTARSGDTGPVLTR